MNTKKLRLHISPRGWAAAWFPGEEMDGKLFHGDDAAAVVEFMYRRRLHKQLMRMGPR